MKKLLSGIVVVFISVHAGAQEHEHYRDHKGNLPCYTDFYVKELRKDPAIRAQLDASRAQLEEFTKHFIENEYDPNSRNTIYTIPVVFHVLHTWGSENISDEQILDALARINEDFGKQNNNWHLVNQAFLPLVADVQVEFKLAKKKPNGECFKGITRTFSQAAWGDGNAQVQAIQAEHGNFPSNRYLNIFVVPFANGAAGYTNYPSNWGGTSMSNGIWILHNYTGRIGTSTNSGSTALSHEIGHWFNLPHTWGDSNSPGLASNCNTDDGVADTPNTIGWTSCNVNGVSCGSLDNVENFMEYSYCSKMFTEGQKARMHAALNSSVGGRNNLYTTSNLTQTGVNDPLVFCRADFRTDRREICTGTSVQFIDESVHTASTWSWSFPGGTPATSNEQNPIITYNIPGVYSVTLTAGDGTSSNTRTRTEYITVLPKVSTLPVLESFENYSSIQASNKVWREMDFGNNNKWQIFTGAGFTGNRCARIVNLNQPVDGIDELISQSYNFSGLNPNDVLTMSFRTSFKRRDVSNTDRLRVMASTDCGQTWSTRRTLSALNLSVGDNLSTSWVPSTQDDWKTWHVTNINSNFFTDNVMFKFEFKAGGGNNIYLDDINIYLGNSEPLNIDNYSIEQVTDVVLYPNPAEGEMAVELSLVAATALRVRISDLSGKEIEAHQIQAQSGQNVILMDVAHLAQGLYLLEITGAGAAVVKQFTKK
jgi:PKD repeat protein